MDLKGSSVPGQATVLLPTHHNPLSHVNTFSGMPRQPLTAADPTTLRSVESGAYGRVGGDDDVQIIFSVPRRRKKRRKSLGRLESSDPIAIHNRQCRHQEGNFLASSRSEPCPQIYQLSVNPSKSTDFNQAPDERRVPVGGIHFSSIGPSVFRPNHDFQPTEYASTFGGNQRLDFSSLPTPWWEPPPARAFSNPIHDIDWRSMQAEDGIGRKRRHPGDWEMPPQPRFNYRQSIQISPRTNPTANFAPLSCPQYGLGFDPQDTYRGSNNTPTPQPSWPSFDWNSFNDADTNSFISQSLQQAAILTEPPAPSRIYPSDPPQQHFHISEQLRPMNSANSLQQKGCTEGADIDIDQMVPGPSLTAGPRKISDQSQDMSLKTPLPNSEIELGTDSNIALVSRPQEVSQPPQENSPPQTLVPEQCFRDLNSVENVPSIARTPDIIRKPSLYKIPPWPPSLTSNVPEDKPGSDDARRTHPCGSMSKAGAIISNDQASSLNMLQIDGISRTEQQHLQKNDSVAANNAEFRIPKARAGRKSSPNLIVDIAETCQEIFPFASVAERHKVPLKKVFDTFSAIIQLPLLRNSDDRRRHGSLGKRRVKEYRDAKRAMERAQEAERKAQMKALRARVEEAGKNGKSVSGTGVAVKPNDILKVIVLNNTLDSEGGGIGSGAGSNTMLRS